MTKLFVFVFVSITNEEIVVFFAFAEFVFVTDEEGVILEDVSRVDRSHVLIRRVAAVLIVLNLFHRLLLVFVLVTMD